MKKFENILKFFQNGVDLSKPMAIRLKQVIIKIDYILEINILLNKVYEYIY